MSYRIETEQSGVKAIVVSGWEAGIAKDPYSGVANLLNVNLSVPDEVSVGYPITTSTQSGATMQSPIHDATQYAAGSAVAYYMLDSASKVFKATSISGTWTYLSTSNTATGADANNQGLAYWKGYLFKFRSGKIDYLAGGAGTWVSGWDPATGSTTASNVIVPDITHYALVSQDDALYFCNGSGVGSILEVAGTTFDPTNTATYSFAGGATGSTNALNLPTYDTAQSIAEQGTQLLVGGSLNAIYPWDRLSTSFNYPIFIGDSYIKRMVTVNTNVYVFPGNTNGRGRIYVTNGSQVNLFYKIPDYLFGEQDPYFEWGDAIYHRNNIIFGFFIGKNSGSGVITDSGIGASHVWAIDLDTNAFRGISRLTTSNSAYSASSLIASVGSSPGFAFAVGARVAGGGDGILGYSGTTSGIGTSTIITDLIPVGTLFEKRTFTQVEFKLRTPLASGESITITPIVDGTTGTAFTTSDTDGIISDVYVVNFEKAQWLQFKIESVGNSATSGVRLKELRIR